MKTNAKQRAEFGTAGGVTHYTPDEFTRDLIADVDAATRLLEFVGNAPCVAPDGDTLCGVCLSCNVRAFLKEPKR